ncbi:UNVERIFIED_CONTAM: hypothetical protein Sradi_4217300 [Sesamum radiatum]|uniref:Reverse transcriptase domain-containing protein n=1 Tax=Sesamum radiatum TaxID=300843 RepID=A0AAW2P7B8_SESRA
MEAIEEVKMIEFFGDPSKAVKIGTSLDSSFERNLTDFLREHSDVFAWEASDMQGVSPEIMVHKLNVHPEARPVKQKKRAFGVDRNRIIKEEVGEAVKDQLHPTSPIPRVVGKCRVSPKTTENGGCVSTSRT